MMEKLKSATSDRLLGSIVPSEIPHTQLAARVTAGIENEQARALNEALDAAGIDDRLNHHAERRQQVILDVADAIAGQNFAGWWFETIGSEAVENPADAAEYAGLSGEEWHDQLREWYRDAYGRGLVDTPPGEADPAEIGQAAARVVEARYGVSLREFVAFVVTWDRGKRTREVLAGPLDAHTQVIRRLTDEIEQRNERIEELEAQV